MRDKITTEADRPYRWEMKKGTAKDLVYDLIEYTLKAMEKAKDRGDLRAVTGLIKEQRHNVKLALSGKLESK